MNNRELLLSKNFIIGIPTRGRVHLIEKQSGVWKYFLKDEVRHLEYPLYAFVRNDEYEEYRRALEGYNVNLVRVSDNLNIAQKRDFIYKFAAKLGKEHVFILNDDVDMYFRKESLSSKYTNKYDEVVELGVPDKMFLESILLCSEEYPIVGFPLKQGSFAAKYTFEKNTQIIHLQCYHIPTLRKEDINHDGMGVVGMSDRWVQLSLLKKGYKTLTNYRYCVGDAGTGKPGGCTIFRTPELVSEAAITLREKFPEVVDLKIKSNGNWSVPRWDCTIHLKRYLPEGELKYIPAEEGLAILRKGGMNV